MWNSGSLALILSHSSSSFVISISLQNATKDAFMHEICNAKCDVVCMCTSVPLTCLRVRSVSANRIPVNKVYDCFQIRNSESCKIFELISSISFQPSTRFYSSSSIHRVPMYIVGIYLHCVYYIILILMIMIVVCM
jgi:hypothetical protein